MIGTWHLVFDAHEKLFVFLDRDSTDVYYGSCVTALRPRTGLARGISGEMVNSDDMRCRSRLDKYIELKGLLQVVGCACLLPLAA